MGRPILEEWRPVCGFETSYEVSNMGRVRRIKSGYGTYIGRLLTPCLNQHGYLVVSVRRPDRRVGGSQLVHILVARAFLGEPPTGMQVNHRDGNKANPCLANLEYVTHQGNQDHATANGLRPYGPNNGMAKKYGISQAMIDTMRKLAQAGRTYTSIAKELGVGRTCVANAVKRVTWRYS